MRATHLPMRRFTCDQCRQAFEVRTAYVRHRETHGLSLPRFCGRACMGEAQRKHLTADNIFDFAMPEPNSGCWLWLGSIWDDTGYGRVGLRAEGAHRAVFSALVGPLAANDVVRHHCDNPLCVNPAHLAPGSHRDNKADSVRRRRHAHGERNGRAVLSEADVLRARHDLGAGQSQASVARSLGVQHGVVHRIANDRTWRHVKAEAA